MKTIVLACLTLGLGSASMAMAQIPLSDKQKDALSELSMELTNCSAYYGIISECAPPGAGPAETARKSKEISDNLARATYATGKVAGLTNDAMLGRMKLATDVMGGKIQHSCRNLSSLYPENGLSCKALYENTESRLRSIIGNLE